MYRNHKLQAEQIAYADSVTDANNRTTTYQYDDADRLVAVTDAAQNSTIYGYDTENNMVGITDAANHQTAFAYDALGRVTQARR